MCFEVKVISIIFLNFVFLNEQSTLEISYLFILLLTHVFFGEIPFLSSFQQLAYVWQLVVLLLTLWFTYASRPVLFLSTC